MEGYSGNDINDGQSGRWSREKILEKVIKLYESGTELTSDNLIGHGLKAAIWNCDFFDSVKDVREAAAQKLESDGYPDDAEKIREYKRKWSKGKKWSKRKIVNRLQNMYEVGESLKRHGMPADIMGVIFNQDYFDSLIEAREALAKRYERKGKYEDAKKIRVYNKTELKKLENSELDTPLEDRLIIKPDEIYVSDDLPDLDFKGELTGKEIYGLLMNSEVWLTRRELSERLNLTDGGVRGISHHLQKFNIKYEGGSGGSINFYHSSFTDIYSKMLDMPLREGSISHTARVLGVSTGKIWHIITRLGIPTVDSSDRRIVSEQEFEILKEIIEREKRIIENIGKTIEPDKEYKLVELVWLGVPESGITNRLKHGEIPFRWIGDTRYVKGEDVLEYFEDNSGNLKLAQTLQLISYFNPQLYTPTDIMRMIKKGRNTVNERLRILGKEKPGCCYRLRRSESDNRSCVLVPENTIKLVKHWDRRNELHLINSLVINRSAIDTDDVRKSVRALEDIITNNDKIGEDLERSMFEYLKILRDFQKRPHYLGDSEMDTDSLRMICSYMKARSYGFIELDNVYSLEEVEGILENLQLAENVSYWKNRAELNIFWNCSGLVYSAIKKLKLNFKNLSRLGINYEDIEDSAKDSVLYSISKFDIAKGYKLSTFVYHLVRWRIFNLIKKKKKTFNISLFSGIGQGGDERNLIDIIADPSAPQADYELEIDDLKAHISQLLIKLTKRQKEVIERRFGLNNRMPETLQKISDDLNLTRGSIIQIEAKALDKLKYHAKQLIDAYIMED